MLPKLDGISVLKELKADVMLGFIPIILVTAKAEARDIVRGLEAGSDDYLTKPLEHAALVARVRSLLRIRTSRCRATAGDAVEAANRATLELEQVARGAGGRATRANRTDRPSPAIFGAASGANDCFHGCPRVAFGEPPEGGNGVVLRSARVHRLYRCVRA